MKGWGKPRRSGRMVMWDHKTLKIPQFFGGYAPAYIHIDKTYISKTTQKYWGKNYGTEFPWEVVSVGLKHDIPKFKKRHKSVFRRKSDAIKFAKSWMRKNPNG